MDRPPVQTLSVGRRKDRRLVLLAVSVFFILWTAAAVYVRAKPVGLPQGILFAAPFLFVSGIIVGPPLLGLFRRHCDKRRRASGAR
jgi:hypothetical protein